MKKILLIGTALSSMVVAPALAADMGVRQPAPVYRPPPPVVVTTWTGCYIGGEAGGLWARNKWSEFGSHDANSWLAGVRAGCDWQFSGGWLIGIQADYDWTDAKGSSVNALFPHFTDESRVRSVGSASARLGYGWDRFLFYVKGGGAWEHDNFAFIRDGVTFSTTGENPRFGWTVGVGGEYLFTNWLSGFIEYDFYDFGSRDVSIFTPSGGTSVGIRETNNVVKAGLNFRFGNWSRY